MARITGLPEIMACWAGSAARWEVAKRGVLSGVGAQRRAERSDGFSAGGEGRSLGLIA
ncbi:hypothetical protein AMTR_s00003p00089590 [Amborella trichopoda]|uniref:Uncharacterized protein n=1 Tax=Amborella trichopoda TaxID=13333 RepID=W1P690_AMBTC|nr:hypothetical protein AMTR_s00003p00089590 [Amborella trichopoda]